MIPMARSQWGRAEIYRWFHYEADETRRGCWSQVSLVNWPIKSMISRRKDQVPPQTCPFLSLRTSYVDILCSPVLDEPILPTDVFLPRSHWPSWLLTIFQWPFHVPELKVLLLYHITKGHRNWRHLLYNSALDPKKIWVPKKSVPERFIRFFPHHVPNHVYVPINHHMFNQIYPQFSPMFQSQII